MTRSALLALVGLALVVAGCGGGDENTATATSGDGGASTTAVKDVGKVSYAAQDQYSQLPMFIAQEKGFFEKNGISDFQFVAFTSIPAMFTAVQRGQVDFAQVTPLPLQIFNEQSHADFRYFMPVQNASLTWVVPKDSSIPAATADDWKQTVLAWKGKRIGVPALGGLVDAVVRYMAKQAGLDPAKDMAISALGTSQAASAAIKNGVIDVASGDPFSAGVLTGDGAGRVIVDQSQGQGPDIFTKTLQGGLFAPKSRITKEADKFGALSKAIQEARDYMFDPANEADVKAILEDKLKVSDAAVDKLYGYVKTTFDIELTPETIKRTGEALKTLGLWKAVPSYDDLVSKAAGDAGGA